MTKQKTGDSRSRAKQIITQNGGLIQTSEALQAGIHPRTLYQLRDSGELEQISRGIYRLIELEAAAHPDLVIVATRISTAVLCLVSALSFHELTTQIPHAISVAIPKNQTPSKLSYPPIQFHKFSPVSYRAGIEQHTLDGVRVKVYNPEKTLADCFKFRNKIGMDIVLEALKSYRARGPFQHQRIMEYAKLCRVNNVIRPYLEALL